jgi:hypothetical protein
MKWMRTFLIGLSIALLGLALGCDDSSPPPGDNGTMKVPGNLPGGKPVRSR